MRTPETTITKAAEKVRGFQEYEINGNWFNQGCNKAFYQKNMIEHKMLHKKTGSNKLLFAGRGTAGKQVEKTST